MKKLILNKDRFVALKLFDWQKDLDYTLKMHDQAGSTVYDDFDNKDNMTERIYNRLSSGRTLAYMVYANIKGNYKRCGIVYLTNIVSNLNAVLHPVMDREGYRQLLKHGIKRNAMKEASNMLIDEGFKELGLKRITGAFHEHNKSTIRFCEGLGFKKEGLLRNASLLNNKPVNSIILGLIKEDFNYG